MDLGIAGMISAGGNAAAQSLQVAQTGFINSWLQQEREKLETARLQMHEDFESRREARGYAHADALQTKNQEFEAGQNQQKFGADITKTSLAEQNAAVEKEKDRTLKGRELDIQQEHYKNQGIYYRALADAASEKVAKIKDKLDPAQQAQVNTQMKLLEIAGEMFKPGVLATPEALEDAKKQLASITKRIDQIVGVEVTPDASTPYTIRDPFRIQSPIPLPGQSQSPAAGGRIAPPNSPATATGMINVKPQDYTVEPTRPTIPRGRLAPQKLSQMKKKQLDYDVLMKRQELEQAKVHGNRARVLALQQELDALEAQQGAGSELAASQGSR